MPSDLTLALAGHASNRPANIDALLSDMLGLEAPDEEGYRPLPDRYSRLTGYVLATNGQVPDGLLNALDVCLGVEGDDVAWHLVTDKVTGQIEQLREYVDEIHEEADPVEFLIGVLHGSDGQLLINWDQDSLDDDDVIDRVHKAGGIPVRDLVQGLHTLLPAGEEEEEEGEPAEPDEEETTAAPPEQAPEELPEEDQELEETPAPEPAAPASLEEEVSAAHRQRTSSQPATGKVSVDALWLEELYRILDSAHRYADAEDLSNAAKNLDALKTSPLNDALAEQRRIVGKLLVPESGSTAADAKPVPKKTASKNGGKKSRVMWDDDKGEWVKTGRGRVRDGVKTAWMDAAGNVTDTK